MAYKKLVFICSPFEGNRKTNVENARRYAKMAVTGGCSPIVPHLLFPQFLNDADTEERLLGIEAGVEQLKICDEVWVFGMNITKGMEFELEEARRQRIPVLLFDLNCHRIRPHTLRIDDRVNQKYIQRVERLKLV